MAAVTTEDQFRAIEADAGVYPTGLFTDDVETALILFAARFEGRNDSVHFARAGIRAELVDTHGPGLEQMAPAYPGDWTFVHADAWQHAEQLRDAGVVFDIVSADTYTGDDLYRSMASLDLWCSVARVAVVATCTEDEDPVAPSGWQVAERMARGGKRRAEWLVLTRC